MDADQPISPEEQREARRDLRQWSYLEQAELRERLKMVRRTPQPVRQEEEQ